MYIFLFVSPSPQHITISSYLIWWNRWLIYLSTYTGFGKLFCRKDTANLIIAKVILRWLYTRYYFKYCAWIISLNPHTEFMRYVLYARHFVGRQAEDQSNKAPFLKSYKWPGYKKGTWDVRRSVKENQMPRSNDLPVASLSDEASVNSVQRQKVPLKRLCIFFV